MWTLGLALWMFDRDRAPLIEWLRNKFMSADPGRANIAALAMPMGETEISRPSSS
jgi:2-oxoglutarate ferredoxin oxidoreductase subunit alpha